MTMHAIVTDNRLRSPTAPGNRAIYAGFPEAICNGTKLRVTKSKGVLLLLLLSLGKHLPLPSLIVYRRRQRANDRNAAQ